MRYRLVHIEWYDAESNITWQSKKEVKKWSDEHCLINEVGWIINETKQYIIICSQLICDGTMGNKTKIPRVWIKNIKPIGEHYEKK